MKACRAKGPRGGRLGPRTRHGAQDLKSAREKGLASTPTLRLHFPGNGQTPQPTGRKDPGATANPVLRPGPDTPGNWNQWVPGGILKRVAGRCTLMLTLRGSLAAQTTRVSVTHATWAAPEQRGPSSVHVFIGHLQETLQNQRLSHQQGNSCPALTSQAIDGVVLPSSVSFCPSWLTLSRSPWAGSTLSKTCPSCHPDYRATVPNSEGTAQPGPHWARPPASPTPPDALPSVLPKCSAQREGLPSHEATPTGTMLSMGPLEGVQGRPGSAQLLELQLTK